MHVEYGGFCVQFCLANKAEDCAYWVGGWVGCVLDVCGVSVELQDGGSFVERVLFCSACLADSADVCVDLKICAVFSVWSLLVGCLED